MDELIGLVAVIGIFIFPVAALGTGWVILLRNRHEERIKMIDKGVILAEPERSPNRYPALRNGLFMVGLAIGLIVGMFVEPSVPVNDFEFMVIPTFAVLFGGLGFIVYFALSRKLQMKERLEDKKMNADTERRIEQL